MMTSYVDRQEKPKLGGNREADIRLKNNRLGMTIFQISWIMIFFAMIIVNWQLRFSYATVAASRRGAIRPTAAKRRNTRALDQFGLGQARITSLAQRSHRGFPDALARRDGARHRFHGDHCLRIRVGF